LKSAIGSADADRDVELTFYQGARMHRARVTLDAPSSSAPAAEPEPIPPPPEDGPALTAPQTGPTRGAQDRPAAESQIPAPKPGPEQGEVRALRREMDALKQKLADMEQRLRLLEQRQP
jgi:hypothetical protein